MMLQTVKTQVKCSEDPDEIQHNAANSEDSDETQHNAAFHLGLHCLIMLHFVWVFTVCKSIRLGVYPNTKC